jgi:hypothetical protein
LTDIVVPFGYDVRGLVQDDEQRPVDLVSVGPGDGVRPALDDDELHVVDQAGQPLAGVGVGQDPVGVALHGQHRDVDLGQVVAEVGLPGADARYRRRGGSGGGDVPAGLERLVADQGAAEHVDVVEVVEKPLHPRRGICSGGLDEPVEQAGRQPFGVVAGLQQERRDRGHQHALGHPR